ncbi:hypothetical protein FHS00_003022 [Limimaricola variabilis]|uniref:Uncharacterized protein n=1 Tax=Limimaricola variabilis TaxID=1492771 RepID=A0ABR6HS77_9RHOB|nr:hypothetical protein [Limimaricola variabilis]MBB3713418.1 hypothetical protein [Limimaricola variabilis]
MKFLNRLGAVHSAFLSDLRLHIARETWMHVLAPWAIDERLQMEALDLCDSAFAVKHAGALGCSSRKTEARKDLQSAGHACFDAIRPLIEIDRERFLANYAACERRIRRGIEMGVPIDAATTRIESGMWIRFCDGQPMAAAA